MNWYMEFAAATFAHTLADGNVVSSGKFDAKQKYQSAR